jgi:SAM-dependent methyltransferase
MMNNPEFDLYAQNYDEALSEGISVSGESKDYFSEGRVRWLASKLTGMGERPASVMDFGCGTGSASPYLLGLESVRSVLGVDISPKSLMVAEQSHASARVRFQLADEYCPRGEIDLAFCNDVFHHIPEDERARAADYVFRSLRPGGLFSFWENNPLNPGTRYVMRKCPFDWDAVPLTHFTGRGLLRAVGFEIISTSFQFIFPKALAALRRLEPALAALPLGAQYQILCRKPPLS